MLGRGRILKKFGDVKKDLRVIIIIQIIIINVKSSV